MTATKQDHRPAHAELERLDAAIADARSRAETTRQRAAAALQDLPGLQRAEGEAWAAGDEAGADKARVRRAELLAEAESWRTRILGADEAVEAAQAERRGFIQARGDDLVEEARPDAEAAREGFATALADVMASYRECMTVQSRLNSFVTDYRRHRRDDPALAALATACDRVQMAGVPDLVPLPPVVDEAVA